MMKGPRCSLDVEVTDGRPGCGHGLEVVITRMCLNDLMSKDEIRRSRALPSFLDANSVERVAIEFLCSDVEKHPKDYFRTNISHQECLFKKSYAIGLTWRPSSLAKVGCMALTLTVHVSLFNAEVTKSVTSLLRYLYSSLAWEILLHSDHFCHC